MSFETSWKRRFSKSQKALRPSVVREILKFTTKPGLFSFAGGVPDPALLPVKEIQQSIEVVLRDAPLVALQYGVTEGNAQLLPRLASLATSAGRTTRNENLLVTSGSQQGIDLTASLLLNPGDPIAVTRPCYLGALQVYSRHEPRFLEVDCDEHGPIISELRTALEKGPKFFYIVSFFCKQCFCF